MTSRTHGRRLAMALAFLMPVAVAIVASSGPSSADVTAVIGSAYGYSFNVTTPGGPSSKGPTPLVTLPPAGSAVPITASAGPGGVFAGPAQLLSFSGITVSTQGTLGAAGSVTSSATLTGLNTSGNEVLTAASLSSTCSVSSTGVRTGSTTITAGTLRTDSGDDNPSNSITDHPPVTVSLPTNPTVGQSFDGHLHVGDTTDNFTFVFNEQTVNPDGSLTVTAAHQIFRGPLATGDLFLGQSVCGATVTAPTTTTSTTLAPTTTTTTRPPTTTTTMPPTTTTSTSTTLAPTTTTSTTVGGGTTTTTGGTPSGLCSLLQTVRSQLTAQVTALRAAIQTLPPEFRSSILSGLDAAEAQARAAIDSLAGGCPGVAG